jgi:hypothetical protein
MELLSSSNAQAVTTLAGARARGPSLPCWRVGETRTRTRPRGRTRYFLVGARRTRRGRKWHAELGNGRGRAH